MTMAEEVKSGLTKVQSSLELLSHTAALENVMDHPEEEENSPKSARVSPLAPDDEGVRTSDTANPERIASFDESITFLPQTNSFSSHGDVNQVGLSFDTATTTTGSFTSGPTPTTTTSSALGVFAPTQASFPSLVPMPPQGLSSYIHSSMQAAFLPPRSAMTQNQGDNCPIQQSASESTAQGTYHVAAGEQNVTQGKTNSVFSSFLPVAVPPSTTTAVATSKTTDTTTSPRFSPLEDLARENQALKLLLANKEETIATLTGKVSQLEKQIVELRQLPTGKISQIPVEDMIDIMQVYGSELSDIVMPARKSTIQKASIVRQFRRWNPNFFQYFHHVNGKWEPKLGKQGELERRAKNRKNKKKNTATEDA